MPKLFLVLLGGPGAGKGTQAERLSKNLEIPQVSTGDLFRENLEKGNQAGAIGQRLHGSRGTGARRGDGRHGSRAAVVARRGPRRHPGWFSSNHRPGPGPDELLADLGSRLAVVPYIEVPEDVLLARLAGRWTCKSCGVMYHELYSPPRSRASATGAVASFISARTIRRQPRSTASKSISNRRRL